MSTDNREQSCEARIANQQAGREEQFMRYFKLDDLDDAQVIAAINDRWNLEDILDADQLAAYKAGESETIGAGQEHANDAYEDAITALRDHLESEGTERLDDDVLGVSTQTVMRVELSTGGPGDWLEAVIDEDRDVQSVTYHFNDWFDHAERMVDEGDALWSLAAYYAEVVALPGENRNARDY